MSGKMKRAVIALMIFGLAAAVSGCFGGGPAKFTLTINIMDADLQPLAGAAVEIEGVRPRISGEDGQVFIAQLFGDIEVSVSLDGYVTVNQNLTMNENRVLNVILRRPVPVSGVTIVPGDSELALEETLQLTAVVEPEGAANANVTWESSAADVASVSGDGLVEALAVGTALITATTEDGGFTDTIEVTVFDPDAGFSLTVLVTDADDTEPVEGAQVVVTHLQALNAEPVFTDAAGLAVFEQLKGPIQVDVTKDGYLDFREELDMDAEKLLEVELEPIPIIPVTGVQIDQEGPIQLSPGQTQQLTATVFPEDATNPAVRWESFSPGIATVDENGLVTAVAPGTAAIVVETVDGRFKDFAEFQVSD